MNKYYYQVFVGMRLISSDFDKASLLLIISDQIFFSTRRDCFVHFEENILQTPINLKTVIIAYSFIKHSASLKLNEGIIRDYAELLKEGILNSLNGA